MQIKLCLIIILFSGLVFSQSTTFTKPKKNATTALALSIVPGAGQIYNESYLKAGLLLGGTGVSVGSIIYYQNLFNETKDIISGLEDDDPLKDAYEDRREFYRDSRDQIGFYLLIIYVIASVDAYTGAKLFDFDVDDDVSFYTNFNQGIFRAGINLKLGR